MKMDFSYFVIWMIWILFEKNLLVESIYLMINEKH